MIENGIHDHHDHITFFKGFICDMGASFVCIVLILIKNQQ